MRKLLLILSIPTLLLINFGITNAEGETPTTLTIEVTEQVPGAKCDTGSINSSGTKIYKCTVERGFGTVKSTIGAIIKYFTYITGLAGVLYIIINGIMLSMSGLEQSMKETAKKHIQKVLIGLVLLLLSGVLLNLIAPWIYQ
nr:hypothetical protein [Candidatus Gracilibacteria bacterium]